MIIMIIIIIITWRYGQLCTLACQPTADLTPTFPQMELKDHPASVEMAVQHVVDFGNSGLTLANQLE